MLLLLGVAITLAFVLRLAQYASMWLWPKRTLESLGKWAVITGPTDGIGKAYALQLARQTKMSIVLIGRSQDKLDCVKSEILAICPNREVKIFVVDFDSNPCPLECVKEGIECLDVGLLINNAGVSYPGPMWFEMVTPKFLDTLLDVNVRSVMQMTHLVYTGMRRRGRGAVVCLGSGSSIIADPLLAGYAGSKGAVEVFCKSLQSECRPNNVLIQCQVPLYVATKMSKISRTSLTVPSAEQYAKAGLRVIRGARIGGLIPSPVVISPYPAHALLLEFVSWVPSRLMEYMRLRDQTALHARYMRKTAATKTD